MTGSRALATLGVLCVAAANVATASVFRTIIRSSGGEEAIGLGVQVSQEYVLTTDDSLSGRNQVVVLLSREGTRHHAEVKATATDLGLAILYVPGLDGEPATVAKEAPVPGRFVYLQSFDGAVHDGVFVEVVEDSNQGRRYWFSAASEATAPGTPLMSSCDQLIAVSTTGETSAGIGEGRGVLGSILPDLVAFLQENGVDFQSAPTRCPSLQAQKEEAISAGETLQEEKESLAKAIEELEAAIAEGAKKSQEELEGLESRRRELATALEQKDAELSEKVSEAEAMTRKQAEMEEQLQQSQKALQERENEIDDLRKSEEAAKEKASLLQQLLIFAGVAVAIALIAIAVVAYRRRRPDGVMDAQHPRPTAPDEAGSALDSPQPTPKTELVDSDPSTRKGAQSNVQLTPNDDPKTTIAGVFRPHSADSHKPEPAPSTTDDGQVSEHTADDPVVGWLVVVAGPGKGSEITLGSGQNSVGRGAGARARVDFGDEQISRGAHAIVSYDWKGNHFFLANGTGTNLTYVNGEALLEPSELDDGSQFTIGNTTLRFVRFCNDSFIWPENSPERRA